MREWLSRIDKDSKEARDKRMFEMWMACYTQEEIAEKEGITHQAVDLVLQEMADLPKVAKPSAEHLTDFEIPLYNVWKQQEKTPGSKHFGNTEPTFPHPRQSQSAPRLRRSSRNGSLPLRDIPAPLNISHF